MNLSIKTLSQALAFAGAAALLAPWQVQAQNAAIVNNKPITTAKVDAFVKQMVSEGQKDGPELRKFVVEQLINREVLTQAAEQKGIARRGDVQTQLELARQQILIQALFRDYVKSKPITDAEIKAEYAKMGGAPGEKEFKARHILVPADKEDLAKQLIEQLKKGAKFEDLAKKESKDPGSAANGGDLGWANPAGLVPPFSEAMKKLKKGDITDNPVKTEFGWHVIKLEDVRDMQAPPLEQVKPQIAQELERGRIRKLQEELKAKAVIK
jgi:peptidyl-prolyl cis-trans isomerase C